MSTHRNTAAEPNDTAPRPIAVRIQPPYSETVTRLAEEGRRPVQWQVEMLLREGLKAIGESPD